MKGIIIEKIENKYIMESISIQLAINVRLSNILNRFWVMFNVKFILHNIWKIIKCKT